MECELAAAGPAGRTAWPGSEEDSGCSWKKKGTCQMKSLMSRWKDAVSDFTLTKKKKKSRQKIHKAKHQPRQQEAGAFSGTALLSVSSQQHVTATSAAAFNDIKFLNQAQQLFKLYNIVQQIEARHSAKMLNNLLKIHALKATESHIFPKEKCIQTYSYKSNTHSYPES